jgi:hypothetical protein
MESLLGIIKVHMFHKNERRLRMLINVPIIKIDLAYETISP